MIAGADLTLVRAANPGPLTLEGTNSWVVGRDPAWVVDPGPGLDDHVAALVAEAGVRGGLGGIALTHRHPDHDGAVGRLRQAAGGEVPVATAEGEADVRLADGDRAGPLRALATPGHTPEHLAFVLDGAEGPVVLTGDAVLGHGSVFVAPFPGALSGYLAALRRLRGLDPVALLPGHGPPVLDAAAKLDEYLAHRGEREEALVAALEAGTRTVDGLLDAAWSDVPAELRMAAAVTLAAHLDKLEEEGRLPADAERPRFDLPAAP